MNNPSNDSRRVALAGPINFRDIGGLPTTEGRVVRTGKLFRSDSLHHLTEADGQALGELGIASAIDFRANDELVEVGIGHLGSLDIRHVHLPTTDRVLGIEPKPDWVPPSSAADVYLMMLEGGGRAYAEALRFLTTPGALPAVFFCMAGKDRTGLFSATVLGLLGVPEAEIAADYALTQAVLDEIHARGRARTPDVKEVWARLPADMLGAFAATMEATIAGVEECWGGWEGYADAMGVAPEVVAALRSDLIVSPNEKPEK